MTIKKQRRIFVSIAVCILFICAFLNGCALQTAPAAPAAPAAAPADASAPAPVAPPEPTADCGVPDLQYETEAYALQTLRSRGLVAVIEYDESNEVLPGLVEAQSIEAGVCAQNGQPVTLTIAKAAPVATPEPTPTPKPKKDAVEVELVADPLLPEITPAPVNVVYVDGVAVTPQPTWSADKFEFDFDDPGSGAAVPCG